MVPASDVAQKHDDRLPLIPPKDPTWLKLRAILEDQLADLRRMNDKNLDENSTARLRGRIAQIKEILKFDEPKVKAPKGDPEEGLRSVERFLEESSKLRRSSLPGYDD